MNTVISQNALASGSDVFCPHEPDASASRLISVSKASSTRDPLNGRRFWSVLVMLVLLGCNAAIVAPKKTLNELSTSATEKKENVEDSANVLPQRMSNRIGMALRLIPAGAFRMGTDEAQLPGEFAQCERPQHDVRLTHAFWIGECEVTVGQFRRFMGETRYRTDAERSRDGVNGLDLTTGEVRQRREQIWSSPGFEQNDQHPVVGLSHRDAQEFCKWLSQLEDQTYRLPTEAEWEYACRAGTTTAFSSGESFSPQSGNVGDLALSAAFPAAMGVANWSDQFPFTAPVGTFQPNRWGLFDMHGNVGEWCLDGFDANYYAVSPNVDPTGPATATRWHVVRGGSWYNSPAHCRSAGRHDGMPTAASTTNGFRVVRESSPR